MFSNMLQTYTDKNLEKIYTYLFISKKSFLPCSTPKEFSAIVDHKT